MSKKLYESCLNSVREIADKNGYILNSNEERLKKVVSGLVRNHNEFGKYYCPCKQSRPLNPEKDTLCPCKEWKEEIEDLGHCFCKLFFKK